MKGTTMENVSIRPIKFRAWDKDAKEMRPWSNRVTASFDVGTDSAVDWGFVYNQPHRFVLMQFTGLTDKNGKEIWEGDIVRDVDWGQQERATGQVCWQRTEWVIKKKPEAKRWWNFSPLAKGWEEHLEVIGNIFTNQELINDSK